MKRHMCYIAVLLIAASVDGGTWAEAQCTGPCGDATGNGAVTTSDVIALTQYTERASDTFLIDRECANVDGYGGITMRDLCFLVDHVAWGAPVDCMADSVAYEPIPNVTNFLHYNALIPPEDTSIMVYFDATLSEISCGLAFCVRVLIDSQIAEFGSINADVADSDLWVVAEFGDERTALVPAGYLMGGYASYIYSVPAGRYLLGEAAILITPSASYRTISIELTEWPLGDNTPMVVTKLSHEAYNLNVAPWIVDINGDFNNDRVLSSADVIGLVNFVFKGGRTPYPVPAAGDTNCNAAVTSADIILLVNHVFKNGPQPCDVEGECTINLDQWTCP